MEQLAKAAIGLDTVDLAKAVFLDAEDVRQRRRRALRRVVASTIVLLVGLLVGSYAADFHFEYVWRYELVGLLGATVGTAELLSRYRDAPAFILLSAPGAGYVLINAAASLAAMGIILSFDWDFGTDGDAAAATQVLMAGFGAMALFRSSLLTVKAGGDDVGIGPSSVLSILMAATDRAADRLGAADRAGRVHRIMEDVSYAKARDSLPTVAVALMQNLSPADVAALNAGLDSLENKPLPDGTKAFLLGLKITDVVSTSVLAAAKESLGGSILCDVEETRADDAGHLDIAPGDTLGIVEGGPASAGLPQTPQTPDPPTERAA